jgi:hypothetical protein
MSASVILTKQLDQETADLKKYLSDFLEEKAKDFTDGLKDKIGNMVKNQLLSFYHTPSHDMTLFDEEGKTILADIKNKCKVKNWYQDYESFLNQPNTRCFILKEGGTTFYFFEKGILVLGPNYLYEYSENGLCFSILPHSLNQNMLRTIKHFQLGHRGNLEQGLTVHRLHPEFFHSECTDFEDLCSREYQQIHEKKKEFDRIIEEGQRIENERDKLNKEKKDWNMIQQKLAQLKHDMNDVLRHMES